MASDNFFLLAALPSLGELGSGPPLSPPALRAFVATSPAAALVDAVLLADDLLQHDGVLAGERDDIEPSVLTAEQVRGREALPEELVTGEQPDAVVRLATDLVWEQYFRFVAQLARQRRSRLLGDWLGFEVALRNALAASRARALGLDVAAYLVAADLGHDHSEVEAVVHEWSASTDPLAGLRVLDRARWAWLDGHEPYYGFVDDEIVAYALRLVLLVRWQQLKGRSEGEDRARWQPRGPTTAPPASRPLGAERSPQ